MTQPSDERVVVLGLGYIGLPTATILANHGAAVVGVDTDVSRVKTINSGEAPFAEPDLAEALALAVDSGRLKADTVVPESDVFIVAVPTPIREDRSADLSFIEAAGKSVAPMLSGGELIILESTCPPGTTEFLVEHILALRPDLAVADIGRQRGIQAAHCPERVLPGRIMVELVDNDRIIGGTTPAAASRAARLYERFCSGGLHLTDVKTAELAKLAENAYRDVNIAFANELANVSESLEIDVFELISLANRHPRVNILQPGPGVGGHCIAVDPWFIVSAAPEDTNLIRTAREVNDGRPQRVVEQIEAALGGNESPSIAVFGLAFKADVDDLRESPAVLVAAKLAERFTKGKILAVEPHIFELPGALKRLKNVALTDAADALKQADLVAFMVDHKQFQELPPDRLADVPVVDTRGTWRGVKSRHQHSANANGSES